MVNTAWTALLSQDGYTTFVGVTADALATIERALDSELPVALRSLYVASDGVYDQVGQWWVIWPSMRLVKENSGPGRIAHLPPDLIAFGDNGAGDPFCVSTDGHGLVYSWSAIDGQAHLLAASMSEFWTGWVAGTVTR